MTLSTREITTDLKGGMTPGPSLGLEVRTKHSTLIKQGRMSIKLMILITTAVKEVKNRNKLVNNNNLLMPFKTTQKYKLQT